jgi:hypothetical protein
MKELTDLPVLPVLPVLPEKSDHVDFRVLKVNVEMTVHVDLKDLLEKEAHKDFQDL